MQLFNSVSGVQKRPQTVCERASVVVLQYHFIYKNGRQAGFGPGAVLWLALALKHVHHLGKFRPHSFLFSPHLPEANTCSVLSLQSSILPVFGLCINGMTPYGLLCVCLHNVCESGHIVMYVRVVFFWSFSPSFIEV